MRKTLGGLVTYFEFFSMGVVFVGVLSWIRLRYGRQDPPRMRGRGMRRFGRVSSALTPLWHFSVDGRPPSDIDRRGYVVVSNHESTADPFLLSWLPWDMRWIAKQELFKLPLIGWLMKLSGDIPLKRGDKDSVLRMIETCRQTLKGGLSVMMFPEGTRSPDGKLLPFKDGAFEIAIDAQAPILPLAVHGTRSCRPKGSLWFGNARAVVRVLEPIPTEGLGRDDVQALKAKVRARIEQAVEQLRAEELRQERINGLWAFMPGQTFGVIRRAEKLGGSSS